MDDGDCDDDSDDGGNGDCVGDGNGILMVMVIKSGTNYDL